MHDQFIRELRFRIGAILALKNSLVGLTGGAFLWGTVVIACRVSQRQSPAWLSWGLWAVPAILAAAAWLAWRRTPSVVAVRALVDRRSACGGLLMASDEQSLGAWQERLPEPADIRVRWRGTGLVSAFLAAVVFLATSFLFPQRLATWADPGLEVGNDVQKLTSTIDMLKEEKILEQAKVDFLKEKLKQIQDDASGKNPKKTFDALDNVRDSLSRAAQKSAEAAIDKAEKLGLAKSLAEALRKDDGTVNDSLKKDALAELAALVEKAAEETSLLDQGLDPDLLKELAEGGLSPEDLKKLGEALKGSQGDLSKLVKKLAKARLIDPSLVKQCEKAGDCECEGPESDKICLAKILARTHSQRGGKGGVTEGPGHNPITWTDGSKEDGAKYKEQALPPGALAKLKESIKVGVGKAEPKEGDTVASQGGAIANAATGGGGANTAVVLPQHRAAVQRFFNRAKE